MQPFKRFFDEQSGSSAAEFALVLPGLLLLTLGTFYLCFLMYAASTLHYAVEDAARCRSVKVATCSTAALTQTYALSRYRGPNISAVFVATQPACGNQVVGSGAFSLRTGIATLSVPLNATACFPT